MKGHVPCSARAMPKQKTIDTCRKKQPRGLRHESFAYIQIMVVEPFVYIHQCVSPKEIIQELQVSVYSSLAIIPGEE